MKHCLRLKLICIVLLFAEAAVHSERPAVSPCFPDAGTSLSREFKVTADEMLLQPKHIYNFSGTITIRPDVRQFGFGDCFSPPYFANPFQATWTYDHQPIGVSDYTWYPSETILQGHLTDEIAIVQHLIPLSGRRAFVCKLILENRGDTDFKDIISLEMKGGVGKVDEWGWMPPFRASEEGDDFCVQQKMCVFTSKGSTLVAAFKPEPLSIDEQAKSISFLIDLHPAKRLEIIVAAGIGDSETTAGQVQSLIHSVEDEIAATARKWENKIQNLQERLPRLITDNEKLKRFYQRSLLTFLTTQWDLEDAVFCPWYSESGIDGGGVCNYLWGDAYISKFLPLADPASTRSLLLTSMEADYSTNYAINFRKGEGLGVGYSYDYYSMALLAYDYIAITGDSSILKETVRGKPFIDALYDYVFEREEMTKPPVLIDYGENHNLLELRRTKAYEHYTPSPNLERILSYQMMDELFRWAGRKAPVDFNRRADHLRKVLFDELWNEDLKWFHCRDKDRQLQLCYSIQIFDMLRVGVLSRRQAEGLVKHLNEQEFLSEWGVHSMSKKDPGYDPDDMDWGGPGVYAGDAPELVMDLLNAGFEQEGIDVLKRILWWGELPYMPQAVRADVRDYRRDGRGNVIAAFAGSQTLVWGLFGIRVDGEKMTIDPIRDSYIAGMGVENIKIRGCTIKIAINPDGKGYLVDVDGDKIHKMSGQVCTIPLMK